MEAHLLAEKGDEMRRTTQALAFIAVLSLALVACASSKDTGLTPGPTEEPGGGGLVVDMTDTLRFEPKTLTIKVGETVTWKNVGQQPHTVTADDGKAFDSGIGRSKWIPFGQTFAFTFGTAGTYPYYCFVHGTPGNNMIGTIVVQ